MKLWKKPVVKTITEQELKEVIKAAAFSGGCSFNFSIQW